MSNKRGSATVGDGGQNQGLVPKLRFPEFADFPLYEIRLGDVTKEGTTRNKGKLKTDAIMGVSKEDGMVPMKAHVIAGDISRYKIVRKDWFAYNPMRLNIGSIARWHGDADALVSPDYVVLHCPKREKGPSLLPVYFDHFRRSKQWDAFTNEAGDGGVRVRIYYADIAQIRIVLPDNAEQQKIADCLSSLDALIAAQGERLAALREYKKGLMQQLFPRPERIENGEKIPAEAIPRLRFPEFQHAGRWEPRSLGAISAMRAGSFIAASDIVDLPGDGLYPCYGGNGLRGYARTHTHNGSYSLIGRQGALCGNVNFVTGKFHATEHAIVVTPEANISNEWLCHALVQLDLNRYATGQAQPGLSVEVLERINCPTPADQREQRAIANSLSAADALIDKQEQRLAFLKLHKSGLMQGLFPSPVERGP